MKYETWQQMTRKQKTRNVVVGFVDATLVGTLIWAVVGSVAEQTPVTIGDIARGIGFSFVLGIPVIAILLILAARHNLKKERQCK